MLICTLKSISKFPLSRKRSCSVYPWRGCATETAHSVRKLFLPCFLELSWLQEIKMCHLTATHHSIIAFIFMDLRLYLCSVSYLCVIALHCTTKYILPLSFFSLQTAGGWFFLPGCCHVLLYLHAICHMPSVVPVWHDISLQPRSCYSVSPWPRFFLNGCWTVTYWNCPACFVLFFHFILHWIFDSSHSSGSISALTCSAACRALCINIHRGIPVTF